MSERRENPLTGASVLIVPGRAARPADTAAPGAGPESGPAFDPDCPFCPGNEAQLAGVVWEEPSSGSGGWRVRVVPNRYPIVAEDGAAEATDPGPYGSGIVSGRHEVIVESPAHDRDLPTLAPADVERVVSAYRARWRSLTRDAPARTVSIFRNRGRRAGASLVHPHSQLIALDWTPPRIRALEERARTHFETTGRCLLCDLTAFERRDDRRIIAENDAFVAFVPWAAECPAETWIVPTTHQATFGELEDAALPDLAAMLRSIAARIARALGEPDYNGMVETSAAAQSASPHLHWFLRLRPRTAPGAGFELGAGMHVNPSRPEEDAAVLRAAGGGGGGGAIGTAY